MKNKFIALALVTLSIATTTVSCTKDDVNPTDVKAQNVETTNVAFNVTSESANSATGKQINRGAIPLYVNNIRINAVSSALNPFTATELFEFSATPNTTLPNGFSLPNVALGTNTFNATSTSADANKVLTMSIVNASANTLADLKAKTPYIPCFSINNPTAVIKKTGNSAVNLTMDTNNGRVIAKFVQETPDADNYKTVVTATIGGQEVSNYVMGASNTNMQKALAFEWSNETCVEGAIVTFKIDIYEGDVLLNTINKSITVQKAKSTLATYTIKNGEVHTDIEQGGILISFPTIGEVIINE